MKTLIIFDQTVNPARNEHVLSQLNRQAKEKKLDLYFFSSNDNADLNSYEIAFCIAQDVSILEKMPNLKLVISNNAGVENIIPWLKDRETVQFVRLVNPLAIRRMASYTLACILDFEMNMQHWRENQINKIWQRTAALFHENLQIGVMGYGQMGKAICEKLAINGYAVKVLSKTAKNISYEHDDYKNIDAFLKGLDALIVCLPTTPETIGMVNAEIFAKLNPNAILINIGRGDQLIEADLLKALDENQIARAYLDVFAKEPLAIDHIFWHHPKIQVTPHIAGVFSLEENIPLAIQVCADYLANRPLQHLVSCINGY